jgi:hypothetical protein
MKEEQDSEEEVGFTCSQQIEAMIPMHIEFDSMLL